MHITRRAPELSATSRLVCIWIMTDFLPDSGAGGRGVLRQDFPGLQLRLRGALDDPRPLAFAIDVGLVVGVVLLRTADGLLQQRVQEGALDLDDNRLVAL